MAGALGRDHEHVEIGARLDQLEMDVEAVGEGEGGAFLQVGPEMVAIERALQFVRRQHHDDIGPGGRGGRVHHGEARGLGLGDGGRPRAQRDAHVDNTGITQIGGMGMALAAIADDDDLLVADQADIGVAIVIDTHGKLLGFFCNGMWRAVIPSGGAIGPAG